MPPSDTNYKKKIYRAIALALWLYRLRTLVFDDVAREAFAVDSKMKTSVKIQTHLKHSRDTNIDILEMVKPTKVENHYSH